MSHPFEQTQTQQIPTERLSLCDIGNAPEVIDILGEDFGAAQTQQLRAGRIVAEINNDGSATYKLRKEDTLRSISSTLLRELHKDVPGYKPVPADVALLERELASYNPKVAKTMQPGEPLNIPSDTVFALKTAQHEPFVVRNISGDVTEIFHPSGERTEISRYQDGSVATLKDADGSLWIDAGANHWLVQKQEADGQYSLHNIVGCVNVAADGTVTIANESDGIRTTQFPDGIILQENAFEMEVKH